eukprot:jgi/Psemu1/314626/fgenesh1_kg.1631_\
MATFWDSVMVCILPVAGMVHTHARFCCGSVSNQLFSTVLITKYESLFLLGLQSRSFLVSTS